MVAIVTGGGLGLDQSSRNLLGGAGTVGQPAVGQAGDNVYVNAATGDLAISSTDEMLFGLGPDATITNTYNSLGNFTDQSGDNWQMGLAKGVTGLTGAYGAAGSTVIRTDWDGSKVTYAWNSADNAYVAKDTNGPYDTLTLSGTTWTWTNGATQVKEAYDTTNSGRITASTDTNGDSLTYAYTGGLLTRVTTQNGEYTNLVYSGTKLTEMDTFRHPDAAGAQPLTQITRVRYGYDTSGRLQTVTVDLTPNDNTVSDGKTYVTTYTYDPASGMVNSISQSDGSVLEIGYALVGSTYRVSSFTQTTSAGGTSTGSSTGSSTTSSSGGSGSSGSTSGTGSSSSSGSTTYTPLVGDGQADNLTGGATATTISGFGAGSRLNSGVGPTTYVFSSVAQSTPSNQTTILDFKSGDLIDLTALGSNLRVVQQFDGQAGEVLLAHLGTDNWQVQVDTTGAGTPNVVIHLVNDNVPTLTAANLILSLHPVVIPPPASYTGTAIVGDGFEDILAAGSTASTFWGFGAGSELIGGSGQDTYVFNNIGQSTPSNETGILNFKDGDLIDLSNLGANMRVVSQFDGQAGEVVLAHLGSGNWLVEVDATGTGVLDFAVHLKNDTANLGAANFILTPPAGSNTTTTPPTTSSPPSTPPSTTGPSSTTTFTYDTADGITTVTDPLGNTTKLSYDSKGELTKIDAALAGGADEISQFTYDANGNVLTESLPGGRAATYTYDARGNRLSQTDAAGDTVTWTYSASNQVLTQTTYLSPASNGAGPSQPQTAYYVYDANNNLRYTISPQGDVVQYVYNSAGEETTTFAYAATPYTTSSLSIGSPPSLATMNSWVAGLASLAGAQRTDKTYDFRGNLESVTQYSGTLSNGAGDATSNVTQTDYVYDQAGELLSSTQVSATSNATTTYGYDGLGRLTSSTDPLGNITAVSFADAQSKTVTTTTSGSTQTSVYGLGGELLSYTDSFGSTTNTTTYTYDADGRRLSSTDPAGVTTYALYDSLGRPEATVLGDGTITQTDYNPDGSVADTILYATKLTATQLASLAAQTASSPVTLASIRPASTSSDQVTRNTYDSAGRLTQTVDPAGVTTSYVYNGASQVTSTTVAGAGQSSTTHNFYDADGRLTDVVDALGYVTQYVYDAAGQRTDVIQYATPLSAAALSAALAPPTSTGGSSGASSGGSGSSGSTSGSGSSGSSSSSSSTTYTPLVGDGQADNLTGGATATTISGFGAGSRLNSGVGPTTYVFGSVAQSPASNQTTIVNFKDGDLIDLTALGSNLRVVQQFDGQAGEVVLDHVGTDNWQVQVDTTGSGSPNVVIHLADDNVPTLLAANLILSLHPVVIPAPASYTGTPVIGDGFEDVLQSGSTASTFWGFGAGSTLIGGSGQNTYVFNNIGQSPPSNLTEILNFKDGDLIDLSNLGSNLRVVQQFDGQAGEVIIAHVGNGNWQVQVDTAGAGVLDFVVRLQNQDDTANLTAANLILTPPAGSSTTTTTTNTNTNTNTTTSSTGGSNTALAGLIATSASDRDTHVAYNSDGTIASAKDAAGATTTYGYDALGRQTTVKDPTGVVTQTTYDLDGRVTKVQVDPTGLNLTTSYAYDASGNVVAKTDADGAITRYVYNGDNQQIYEVDANGDVIATTYDADGRVVSTQAYLNQIAPSTLAGLPLAITAATVTADVSASSGDEITRYVYDAAGRLAYKIDAKGQVCAYVYDPAGNLLHQTEYAAAYTASGVPSLAAMQTWAAANAGANDRTTRDVYNLDDQLAFRIDAAGDVVGYAYDSLGRLVAQTAYGTTYQAAGDPSLSTMQTWATANANATPSAPDRTTRFVLDAAGQQVYAIDAAGDVTGYVYDAFGDVTKQTQYAAPYTASGNPSQATMATWVAANANANNDAVTRDFYDNDGRLVYSVDAMSYVTETDYDAAGKVLQTVRYASAYTITDSDTLANVKAKLPSSPPSSAEVTRYGYDTAGRLTDTLNGNNIDTHLGLDGMGRVLTSTAAANAGDYATTVNTYDAVGNLLSTTKGYGTAAASTTSYTYNAFGNKVTETDPNGKVGHFYYDALNRLTLQVDPLGYGTATTYTLGGQVSSVTRYANPYTGAYSTVTPPTMPTSATQDAVTTFGRDKLDRLTSVIDAENHTESYGLDAFGDRLTVTNKLNGVTINTFDNRGLLLSEILPVSSIRSDGSVESSTVTNTYAYDSRGNRITMVEASGLTEARTTNYTYDLDNRLTGQSTSVYLTGSTTTTANQTTQYDAFGNVIKTTDANGAQLFTYYDGANRKVEQINAVGAVTRWTYDSRGNLASQTSYATLVTLPTSAGGSAPTPPSGGSRVTNYVHDADNRLTSTTLKNVQYGKLVGSTYTYGMTDIVTQTYYDANGNIRETIDGNQNSTYYYYDLDGRKTAQIDPDGYLTTFLLDSEGNVKSETAYATAAPSFGWNGYSLPNSSANDRTTTFTYDRNGNRLSETRANVQASTVDSSTGALTTAPTDAKISYTYDGMGNVTKKSEADGDYTSYGYDLLGRLTHTETRSYSDYRGVTVTPSTDDSYNGLNLITRSFVHGDGTSSAQDRVTTYAYGLGGRLVSVTDPTGFTKTNSYDRAGHLTAQQYGRLESNGTTETDGDFFSYDALGRQASRCTGIFNGTTWAYGDTNDQYYDGYGEVYLSGINTGGVAANAQVTTEYDNAGRVWRTNATDGVTRVYAYDENGNATILFQTTGTVNLRSLANLSAVFDAQTIGGVTETISKYDGRNNLIETYQPTSNNAGANPIHAVEVDFPNSGVQYFGATINPAQSAGIVWTGATATTISSTTSLSANQYGSVVFTLRNNFSYSYNESGPEFSLINLHVSVSSSQITTVNGSGAIHIYEDDSDLGEWAAGTTSFDVTNAILVDTTFLFSDPYSPTFSLRQDLAGGGQVTLASVQLTGNYYSLQYASGGVAVGPSLHFNNVNPNARALHMFVRTQGSTGAYAEFDASNQGGGLFTYDMNAAPFFSTAANQAWDVKYLAMDSAGNIYDAQQGSIWTDGSDAVYTSFSPSPVNGPGQSILTNTNGYDYLLFYGMPPGTTFVNLRYEPAGAYNGWSGSVNGGSIYGQAGLIGFDVTGWGGPWEFFATPYDANWNPIGTAHDLGQFTVGGQSTPVLSQYAAGSRVFNFTAPAGATYQQLRYFSGGVWSSWIGYGAGGVWSPDLSGLTDFYGEPNYPIQYETYNGSTLLSHSEGTIWMGYWGQAVSTLTQRSDIPAQVLFSPAQSGVDHLVLYWRDKGATGAFSKATISNVGGSFYWDIDAAGVRPPAGVRNIEYYYDAYAANGALLPPVNGDDHVHGYLSISSDHYTQTNDYQIEWQIDNVTQSQFLIDRKQHFDAFGEIDSETSGLVLNGQPSVTTFAYNTLGKLITKTQPLVTDYDEHGNAISETPTEKYYYDASGRQVGQRDADCNLTTQILLTGSGYDGSAALTLTQFNADGGKVQNGYDRFGDLRSATDALGTATTFYDYDRADNLTEVDHPKRTSGNSPINTQLIDYYTYDGLGERIRHTNSYYGSSTAETTDYDAEGRVVQTTTFGGLTTTYYRWWFTGAQASTTGLGSFGGWQTVTGYASGKSSIENDDMFGRLIWRRDLGSHDYSYVFNNAGELTDQYNTQGQNISYSYYTNGYLASIVDNVLGMKSTFEYDNDGNRTRETYNTIAASPVFYENSSIKYDALDRVIEINDPKADITYKYDAVGNRREVHSIYTDGVGNKLQDQDLWYKYDSMNRFVLTMGSLPSVGSNIGLGAMGVAIMYDADNNRVSATYGYDGHTENYSYSADGYLENTTFNGTLVTTRTNDALGRVTTYIQENSGASNLTRVISYDDNNRISAETDTNSSGITTTITNSYGAWNAGDSRFDGADQGVITNVKSVTSGVTTNTDYYYVWWDEAKESQIRINASDPSNPNSGAWGTGLSQLTYDVNGHLTQTVDNAGGRVLTYKNDAYGQVLVREEFDSGVLGPRQLYYYFDGRRVGDVGNNGVPASQTDYAQELAENPTLNDKGGFRYGKPVTSADFDENYQPINSGYPSFAASNYTVRAGDTLASIASALWGDSSLWYLIADANGLTASTTLAEGQILTIPNKVTNFHNNSSTFKVYNPGEAIGDTLPTLPPEPSPPPPPPQPSSHNSGCGGIGELLVAVVAVVVTLIVAPEAIADVASLEGAPITGGAAGVGAAIAAGTVPLSALVVGGAVTGIAASVVSQGFGLATGIQNKFNWAGVAESAITAGIGAGLGAALPNAAFGGNAFAGNVVRGLAGNVIGQGVDTAVGLQSKFDWTSVATSAVEGLAEGATQGLGPIGSGIAGDITGGAVRSAITGQSFGSSLRAELPNTIGQTIGNAIAAQQEQAAQSQAAAQGAGAGGSDYGSYLANYFAQLQSDGSQSAAPASGIQLAANDQVDPNLVVNGQAVANDGAATDPSQGGYVGLTQNGQPAVEQGQQTTVDEVIVTGTRIPTLMAPDVTPLELDTTIPDINFTPSTSASWSPTVAIAVGSPNSRAAFIKSAVPAAIASQIRTGVPASVTIAQAAIESRNGLSHIGGANNYFGIKAVGRNGSINIGSIASGYTIQNTKEVLSNGQTVTVKAPFRTYNSMADSFSDHAIFLTQPRYSAALNAYQQNGDALAFARGIQSAGYASDPQYANKLIGIINKYNLTQYDQ